MVSRVLVCSKLDNHRTVSLKLEILALLEEDHEPQNLAPAILLARLLAEDHSEQRWAAEEAVLEHKQAVMEKFLQVFWLVFISEGVENKEAVGS